VASSNLLAAFGIRGGYSGYQLEALNGFYNFNQYPTKEQKENLSLTTNLSYQQINMWFKNKRRHKLSD